MPKGDDGLLETEENQTTVRDRSRDDNRYRNEQETVPKDLYYRPEYGWIMNNAQVAEEKGVEEQYKKAVADAEAQVAGYDEEYNTALASGQSEISTAYDDAIAASSYSGWKAPSTKSVTYTVLGDTTTTPASSLATKNNSYWLTGGENNDNGERDNYSMVSTAASSSKAPDTYTSVSMSDEVISNLNKYLKDNGYATVDAKGNITAINSTGALAVTEFQRQYDEAIESAYATNSQNQLLYDASVANAYTEKDAALSSFNTNSDTSYSGQKAVWEAQLNELRNAYANRVAAAKSKYESFKSDFNKSVAGVDTGLLQSPLSGINWE